MNLKNLFDKSITIVKAKFRNKKEMEKYDWYNERISICGACPYNSKNDKSRGFFYYFWNLVNFSKPFCTICGCEIEAKASEPREECSMTELEKEPKWTSINLKKEKNAK